MKFISPVILILIVLSFQLSFGQNPEEATGGQKQNYFSFHIRSKEEIHTLTNIISIDNVRGDTVWAYANMPEFIRFSKLGYTINVLPNPGDVQNVLMKDHIIPGTKTALNYYPTYTAYEDLLNQFQALYPSICQIQTIAALASGRKILVAKISDNVAADETEPEFFYTSSIHGDETTGYILMLDLMDYLLTNYGSNTEITDLVNNLEIYINPLANPDGTYHGGNSSVSGAIRYNANYVDLNRNYPDPQDGQHPDGNAWQPETMAFMDFATARHFVASCNFHGGAEVVNYPWDTQALLTADDTWWQYVSHEYVDTARIHGNPSYMTSLYPSGITNGYAWYEVNGGRQDYMNYWQHCRELTIELSTTKTLPTSSLLTYWNYNYRSLVLYMKQARYGIHGIITDAVTGLPVAAKIVVTGHDVNNSETYSSANLGDYSRLIKSGTYTLEVSATNYVPQTITGVVVTDHATITLNFQLVPLAVPVVTTQAATSVAATTVTLNGNVNPQGFATTYAFDWGTTTGYGNSTTTYSAGSGTSVVPVSTDLTGLTGGTLYHYRLKATNINGTSTGNDMTFSYGIASVTTAAASSIMVNSATSGGSVLSDGGAAITSRGVCWSTSANPAISGSHTTDGSGTGSFISSITGLAPGTLYHVRAYATNSTGTYYGNDLQFTTPCGIISSFPWNEGFENGGTIPNCWTNEQVSSSGINWTFITGNGAGNPAAAHTGTYNACLKDITTADNKTRLITPQINLTGVSSPTLTFWHTQAVSSSRQDQLEVYYKTSAGGTWTLLASYTTSVTTWTQRTISLPNGSGDYYIAFQGNAKRGYGVCIDDVQMICTATPVSVSILASSNPVCTGTSVTFTATPINGGTAPSYQWKVNGINVGTNSASYTYSPENNDAISCVVTSNASCVSENPATSSILAMTVNPLLPVSISVAASANPVISGTSVTFTATSINGGTTLAYQWKVNGVTIGTNNSTFTYIPINNDSVTCTLTSNATCVSGNPATSAVVIMTVNPLLLTVSPLNQNVSDQQGVASYNVNSNTGWTVTSDQPWCLVNSSGTGNGAITASYSQNVSNTERMANITTTVTGLAPITVTLTQQGLPVRQLNLTVMLEGLFNGINMNKSRNASGNQFSGSVADQIMVELHEADPPYVLAGGPYTVNLNTDGSALVTIPASLGSNYYIVVKHRNSIETWNASPLSFSSAAISYNFSISSGQAFGNNLKLVSGKYVMFGGDVNQDGIVDSGDLVAVDNEASNFAVGYLANDVNGDGTVNSEDALLINANASVFVVKIVP